MGYMTGGGKLDMMYQNGGKTDPPRKPGAVLDRNGRPISPMRQQLEAAFAKGKGEAYPGQAAKTEKTFMGNAKAADARNLGEMRNALKSEGKASVARFDADLRSKGKGDLVDMFQAKDNLILKITAMPTYKPAKKMAQGGQIPKRANKYTDLSKMGFSHNERVSYEEASKNRQIQEDDLRTGKPTGKNIMLKTYVKPRSMAQGGKLKKPGAPVPLNPTKDNNSFISNAVDMSPAIKKQMLALRQAMMYFTGVSPKNK